MSMFRKFASIAHPAKYGYAYDSSQYDHRAPVFERFRMFETYGDGLIQHSGDWSITVEFLADYLMSLAAVMIDDGELAVEADYRLSDEPRRNVIEFAASVVWKESDSQWEKRRFYSASLLKVGGRKFEHDKRYNEIEKWCDGSPGAMLRMITSEYANGLERYLYADAIRNWCLEVSDKRPWMPLTAQFLKWFEHDHDRSYEIHRAFDAARAITKSWRLRAAAQGYVEDARRQAEPKPDVVLESEPVEAT